ncbi:type I-E CRISPR-associated protein Cse1/CasA [Microbacterium luticocti]|uniref:type I-E CRISPR-associated protein Cse1/CasA n=1 Tax=Microbacterium luticocti TaxID=451764 RepID=UPI000422E7C7|nr:type I-E CRISPR-associated protein Cse1/CasA [Microbacterium luticocti]
MFGLTAEPWILVRFTDGSSGEVSLQDAFRRAREIREIDGETPTQSFAILRLLLAILYRTLAGEPVEWDHWIRWYREGLPLQSIDAYFNEFADRFDLFGARPFMQVADLATASGEMKDVGAIILDLPSNNRLFTNRAGSGALDLSFAEAARWLVNAQAFDPSGIKSGAVGDRRVKGGKGYPIGVAWDGLLGGVYAVGNCLHETLMMNLVPVTAGIITADTDADIPPWEDDTSDTAAERDGLIPQGPVRLYTWQSRRIRLFRSGDRVVGCLVANGDKLTPQNGFVHEPMSAWRFSDPQTKKAKQTTYMPREHVPGRALWRGIAALLPGLAPVDPKTGVPSGKPPGVIDWLAQLEEAGVLGSASFRLRAVGVVYGSNNSVVDDIVADEVSIPLTLLRQTDRVLAAQADEAVRLADEGVRHLRNLADNLARAAGGEGDGPRLRAADIAYSALDLPYRQWLTTLQPGRDPLEAITEWKGTASSVLRRLGAQLVADAGPTAWVGREVTRTGRTELITTPRAEGWFLRSLTRTFGTQDRKEQVA